MLFALDWLKELIAGNGDDDAIAATLTARGLTVDSIETGASGTVLDVDVPANRPDCLGHYGLAREIAAASSGRLREPEAPPPASGEERVEQTVSVAIDDELGCPRYTASLVRGVRVGPSPAWLVKRLEACGLRSVNNAVDVSNLVLLELGQPIHFFDLDRLARDGRARIVVRRAGDGERIETLDGVERTLCERDLLITDGQRPVALAGVIGGADSEVTERTSSILIEAAHFDRDSIRASARRLGVSTDASFRFERGVDPEAPLAAQRLAVRYLAELTGASPVTGGTIDLYPGRTEGRRGRLRLAELPRLLGYRPDDEEVLGALEALGLGPETEGTEAVEVSIPSWRVDLEYEADLVEEVARHLGYDRIPGRNGSADPELGGIDELTDRARDRMAHLGFHEAIGYSMIQAEADVPFLVSEKLPALALSNPLAEQLATLRRSLLPELLRALDRNLRRGVRDVRLFEIGRVFLPREEGAPDEREHLGVAWSGQSGAAHWAAPSDPVDLYDVIGLVDEMLEHLAPERELRRREGGPAAFHPGQRSIWEIDGDGTEPVAWAGALHPEQATELDAPVFLVEIDLTRLGSRPAKPPSYRRVSRFPGVTRDLSFVVREASYAEIVQRVREVPAPASVEVDAIDRYQGHPLEAGESSITLRLMLQPDDRTLTDSETDRYVEDVVSALTRDLGLSLRG